MNVEWSTYIGIITGLIGIWAAIWKWILEPSLDRRFVRKLECEKRHDQCRMDYTSTLDSIRAELHELRSAVDAQAAHIDWIRKSLERLER